MNIIERPTCWLVFSRTRKGLITLRAVCTTKELAKRLHRLCNFPRRWEVAAVTNKLLFSDEIS